MVSLKYQYDDLLYTSAYFRIEYKLVHLFSHFDQVFHLALPTPVLSW